MAEEELIKRYKSFGDDPWILGPDEVCKFSAWKYAEKRALEICRGGDKKR